MTTCGAKASNTGPNSIRIQVLSCGHGQAIGHVAFALTPPLDSAGYFVHPALLDACLQVIGAALGAESTKSGDTQTYLPLGFERFEIWTPGATEIWSHAVIREAPGGTEMLVADLKLFDGAGNPSGNSRGCC